MAARLKIGDIFEVPLNNGRKAYVQYVGNDATALNSKIIRVFKRRYVSTEQPHVSDIVEDEIEFHAHVYDLHLGEKENLLNRVGHSDKTSSIETLLFRDHSGIELNLPEVSRDWQVWHPNEPMEYVGELKGDNLKSEIGSVMPLEWMIKRIETGKYHFKYPDYK